MKEYMEYFKEEILRGLRLFGWANGNSMCITQWAKEYNLNENEVDELREYNKAVSRLPEYQF